MLEIKGTIKEIFDEQTFGSGFNKREFILTTSDDRYPQDVKFETVKEKTRKLDQFNPGDVVTVCFNLRGREYNGKYFVNLDAWRLIAEINEPPPHSAGHAAPIQPPPPSEPQHISQVLPGVVAETTHEEVPF